jgi:hypothetical protein
MTMGLVRNWAPALRVRSWILVRDVHAGDGIHQHGQSTLSWGREEAEMNKYKPWRNK